MNAMSGAGNAGLMYVTVMMFAIGLSSGNQILVARRNGENKPKEAGLITANTILLGLGTSVILLFVLLGASGSFLDGLIQSENVLRNMREFLSVRAWGILFYTTTLIILSFYIGITKTRVLLYSTIITAGVNIVLDYGLIFGNWGLPALGIEGAAYATVSAEIATLIFVIFYLVLDKKSKHYQIILSLFKFPLNLSRRILKISLPIMGQQVVALATWTVFFFLVEKLGEEELQSSHIIRNMYFLIFVSIMGMSQTTKSFISTLIAEKRQDELWPVIVRLLKVSVVGVFLLGHGLWLYPELIASWFTENPEIIVYSQKSMNAVAFAMVVAAFSQIFLSTIEGAGKTDVAMKIEIAAVVVYLSLTALMTLVYPQEIYIVWLNDIIYFGIILVLAFAFLKYRNWKYFEI